MRHLQLILIGLVGALLTAVPDVAVACRVGHDTIIFSERPTPIGLDGFVTVSGRFRNSGPEIDQFRLEQRALVSPSQELDFERSLIGVAYLSGASEATPIYAMVTSCTGNFDSRRLDVDVYLVGRWTVLRSGRKAFVAGGNWNGRWHF
ncbi:hypothetical protein [Brevundimonas vesicularis]|uniref:Uncharacterized protein n=1 Tax=Brevundimonas vesicularis TaxID=41276 RepID=A0A1Z3UCL5_BREVE|nr:hypothetical protein [Brevundimonas vesicularis]ASE41008.1 hypothetical protein CEP68_16810 [Brevundimonas vesicularis]MDX2335125.1 hypothetical protein [Brevundimonas vesicularis]